MIAERAGVGVGSIYRYFKDKDELIHTLFEHIREIEDEYVTEGFDPEAEPKAQFLHICMRMIEYSIQNPLQSNFQEQYVHSPFIIEKRKSNPNLDDVPEDKIPPLARLFRREQSRGNIKNLPHPVIGALTIGAIIEMIRDINAGILEYDPGVIEQAMEACWDAISVKK